MLARDISRGVQALRTGMHFATDWNIFFSYDEYDIIELIDNSLKNGGLRGFRMVNKASFRPGSTK